MSGGFDVVTFEEEDAAVAGRTRASLERAGTPIGPYDVLIAGQALRHGLTVATVNIAEFARVEGLFWENWNQ